MYKESLWSVVWIISNTRDFCDRTDSSMQRWAPWSLNRSVADSDHFPALVQSLRYIINLQEEEKKKAWPQLWYSDSPPFDCKVIYSNSSNLGMFSLVLKGLFFFSPQPKGLGGHTRWREHLHYTRRRHPYMKRKRESISRNRTLGN